MQSGTNEAPFSTTFGIATSSHCSDIERSDCQEARCEERHLHFCDRLHYCFAVKNRSPREQQLFAVNRVAEILDTPDVSQLNHVSGINQTSDIGQEPSMLMISSEVSGSLGRPG